MPRLEDQLPLLGRDEAVLHRVGDPDGDVEPDDPRRPLERVGPRIRGSMTSGEADAPSSATRPVDSVAVLLSASIRNSSSRENPLRSPLMAGGSASP